MNSYIPLQRKQTTVNNSERDSYTRNEIYYVPVPSMVALSYSCHRSYNADNGMQGIQADHVHIMKLL